MILINLLPHREAAQLRRQRQFHAQLVLSVLLACLLSAVIHAVLQHRSDSQRARNQFLQQEMNRLDGEIQSLARLQKEKEALQAHRIALETLLGQRNLPVQLLQELALQTPDGVALTSLKQDRQHILLAGVARSQERVSALLHNLGSSDWLGHPELVEIVAASDGGAPRDGGGLSSFTVRVGLGQMGSMGAVDAGAEPRVSPGGARDEKP